MKAYIRYGSIALMIASLILTGYQMTCGAVLFIFYNDNKTALLYLLRGGLAALIFLLLFYQKELNTAVKNFIARVLTPVERFSFSL